MPGTERGSGQIRLSAGVCTHNLQLAVDDGPEVVEVDLNADDVFLDDRFGQSLFSDGPLLEEFLALTREVFR